MTYYELNQQQSFEQRLSEPHRSNLEFQSSKNLSLKRNWTQEILYIK